MNKLMMVATVAMAVVSVNAATVSWKSGDMMRATSTDGGWSTTKYMTDATAETLNSYYYEVSADDWATVSAMSQSQLYKTYSKQTATLSKSAEADSSTLKIDPATVGKTYYGVVIYSYMDSDLDDTEFYLATTVSQYVKADQKYSVSSIGSTLGASSGWQSLATPVPEPFSGSLALLGLGAIALRRKMKKAKKA